LWRSTIGVNVRFTTGGTGFTEAIAIAEAAALTCGFVFNSLPELDFTTGFIIFFFKIFAFTFGLEVDFPEGFAFTAILDFSVTFALTFAFDFGLGFAFDFTIMTHILS
jgi:hypothetical protein